MLPKKERLTRTEFDRFFSIGRRVHSPSFQVVYAPHASFHASVVVSKKNARLAVERNKIRRRVYDIVRHCKSSEDMSGIFIFLTKPAIRSVPHTSLKEEICIEMKKITKIFNKG